MDKRTPTQSKGPGKKQSAPPRPGLPFWPLVHFVLGLVLVAAGALKLYDLAFEARDESTPTLLLVLAEAELLGGLWMAGWFDPHRTRWWGAAAFAGLALASLSQGLAGKCSCGCFGSLSISPWITLVFDLAAVAALLGSRPAGASEETFLIAPAHWIGLGAIALLIAIAGWRQADLVNVAGRVMADGRPLEESPLTFTGESGRIELRTDRDGHFRLRLVRPGPYAISTPGRIIAPEPSPERRSSGVARRPAGRSRKEPARPRPATSGPDFHWIEIPTCSRYDELIEL
jgi:hypothetical protein